MCLPLQRQQPVCGHPYQGKALNTLKYPAWPASAKQLVIAALAKKGQQPSLLAEEANSQQTSTDTKLLQRNYQQAHMTSLTS